MADEKSVLADIRQRCNLGQACEHVLPGVVPLIERLVSFDTAVLQWRSPVDGALRTHRRGPIAPDEPDIHRLMRESVDPAPEGWVRLTLLRFSSRRDFSASDSAALDLVLRYLAHAATPGRAAPRDDWASRPAFVNVASVVLDARGEPLGATAAAREQIARAVTAVGTRASDAQALFRHLFPQHFPRVPFGGAARDRRARVRPDEQGGAMTAELTLEDGSLRMRIEPLASAASAAEGSPRWIVSIQATTPIAVHLCERVQAMPLSGRQREVCLRLLCGQPTIDIADSLGIMRTTLKDHIQAIYRRLGVANRSELLVRTLT